MVTGGDWVCGTHGYAGEAQPKEAVVLAFADGGSQFPASSDAVLCPLATTVTTESRPTAVRASVDSGLLGELHSPPPIPTHSSSSMMRIHRSQKAVSDLLGVSVAAKSRRLGLLLVLFSGRDSTWEANLRWQLLY